jgi:hypothetical protein
MRQFVTPVTASRLELPHSALSISWWAAFSARDMPGATRIKVSTASDPASLLTNVGFTAAPESIELP